MKRVFDTVASALGLLVTLPVTVLIALLVWAEDRHSPFYVATRYTLGGKTFRMLKFRSMRIDASASGVNSTASTDRRITTVGAFIRKTKLDELPQLWNVLKGEMSLVGPRPAVQWDVDRYTPTERGMFAVRAGITDAASIVFADEGQILAGSTDPDNDYLRIIRPWKSRLALWYADHASLALDVRLILLTLLALFDRPAALTKLAALLAKRGAAPELVTVASRTSAIPIVALP
jgi:lipopolysaccharide/colanic/teichoic acid biosynthesis glycosyltransferase